MFDDVDTQLLKNAINSCIESINYSKSEQIIADITNNSVWEASSRDNFKKSMEKLINVRYKNLENKLSDYLKLVEQIEKYKAISSDMAAMQLELSAISESDIALNSDTDTESNEKDVEKLDTDIKSSENELAVIKSTIESLL